MRELMTGVLKDILSGEDKDIIDNNILTFKKDMKNMPIDDIALPTGVKGFSKYIDKRHSNKRVYGEGSMFTPLYKGTPVHVKASVKYNDLLNYFGLENTEQIKNGNKIKWVYLKQNTFGLDAIAFKGYDDPKKVMDFIVNHIDCDKLYKGAMEKKVKVFYEAMGWELPLNKINTLERFF